MFLQNISFGALAAILFAVAVVLKTISYINEERKIKALGGHASARNGWLPWNLDIIYEGLQTAARHEQLSFWDKGFRQYGKKENPYTVESRLAGRRFVFTADPENIKAILATQFDAYGKGERFNKQWKEFLGDGIFSTDHEKWHASRQLIRPQFVKDRVSDLHTFEHHVNVMMDKIDAHGAGATVNISDLFFRLTLDAATEFLFGRSAGCLEHEEVPFAHAFAEVQRLQSIMSRAGDLQALWPRGEYRRHIRTMNAFVEPYIDEALALPVDELAKLTKSDRDYTFLHALAQHTRDRAAIRDQLVNILLAGRDTTACTLSWIFYEISRQPAIVDKLRAEIESHVGWHRAPTYADLKAMKYLQYTLNETLRLYPVVPYNVRIALKDTTLPRGGGPRGDQPMAVLKDSPVGYSTLYMQHTPEIYPPVSEKFVDPEVFSPDRWFTWQPKPWTYVPFNGGPRICVGQQFALTEMGYTLVRMLQRYPRVESRMTKPSLLKTMQLRGEALDNENTKLLAAEELSSGLRFGEGRTLAARWSADREVKMSSEIVLAPATAVNVALYRS